MPDLDEIDDIHLVMREIATVMSARGTALTSHPEDSAASVVYVDAAAGISGDRIETLLEEHIRIDGPGAPDAHRWVVCGSDDRCDSILLLPVKTIAGHSRLLISVFFDDLTPEQRDEADRIYLERAPFAIGYFKLWQLNRSRIKQVSALQSALNLTEMGVLLVDRRGEVAFANRAAKEMLDRGDGLCLRRKTLRATQLRDSVRLQLALEHVTSADHAAQRGDGHDIRAPLLSLERTNLPPLVVSVLPSDIPAIEQSDIAAIVYVLDPARNVTEMVRPVCQIYNLSPVESRLTCLLVSGVTLADAANKMRIKEMTARSYLKQIFIKTNTHRQMELMQLMLSSIVRTIHDVIPEPMEIDRARKPSAVQFPSDGSGGHIG